MGSLMALKAKIFKAQVNLSLCEKGIYENIQLTLARHPSETDKRLMARLMAYCFCYQSELAFCKGLSASDEPDIEAMALNGSRLCWVDVGLPKGDRLVKASHKAQRVVAMLYDGDNSLLPWLQKWQAEIVARDNIELYLLPEKILEELAANLGRQIQWQFTESGGEYFLNDGEQDYQFNLLSVPDP